MTRINQLGKIRRFGLAGTVALAGHGLRYHASKHLLRRRYLTRRIHDYQLCLDLHDQGLSKDIAIRGTREEQLKYIIDREVAPGDVVLDVGANIGYYAMMLAGRVGPSGKVYAMEPEPGNFQLLQRNIALNGAHAIVDAYPIGASDAEGTGTLYVNSRSNLHSFLVDPARPASKPKGRGTVEVPVTDIPSFIKDKRPVDMMRMDIEGFEVEVLSGLEPVVKDGRFAGKIVFECHFPRYTESHSIREPLRMLFGHGYRVRYMTSTDERNPKIRRHGYEPIALVQTSDTRFRGIFENVAEDDAEALICNTGGVRDVLLEKSA